MPDFLVPIPPTTSRASPTSSTASRPPGRRRPGTADNGVPDRSATGGPARLPRDRRRPAAAVAGSRSARSSTAADTRHSRNGWPWSSRRSGRSRWPTPGRWWPASWTRMSDTGRRWRAGAATATSSPIYTRHRVGRAGADRAQVGRPHARSTARRTAGALGVLSKPAVWLGAPGQVMLGYVAAGVAGCGRARRVSTTPASWEPAAPHYSPHCRRTVDHRTGRTPHPQPGDHLLPPRPPARRRLVSRRQAGHEVLYERPTSPADSSPR